MRKLLLSLFALICAVTASAESYTINFKDYGKDADNTAAFTTTKPLSEIVEGDFFTRIAATNNCYLAKTGYGIKFSSGSKAGSLTLILDSKYSVVPTSIVVNAAKYGSDASEISVNGAEAQALDGNDFKDYTFEFSGTEPISQLKLDATKRLYVKSVTVNYGDGGTDPDPDPIPDPEPTPGDGSMVVFVADGATYTGEATTQVTVSGSDLPSQTFTATGVCELKWTKVNSSTSNVTSGLIRWYQGDVLTITPASGVTVTKVVFNCPSSSQNPTSIEVSTGTIDASTSTKTWTGEASTAFTIVPGKQARTPYIEISYVKGEAPALTAPVITVGGSNMVTIASAENAPIYYTLDGTDPSAASNAYTAPFAITEKCTVKAVCIKDGTSSDVATMLVYLNEVNSIAAFIANGSGQATKINAPLTAIYQNGRNLYLKDAADNFILAYNQSELQEVKDLAATNGDVISEITGTYKLQAGLPEIIPSAVGVKSAGSPVDPYEVNVADIDNTMLNQYVTFGPVTITAGEKANNYEAVDEAGDKIVLYNTFYNASYYDAVTVPEGEGFMVTGFVSCYNSTIQITPVMFDGGKEMEPVATPTFTPESGSELKAGDTITIECATEGATIYYTTENETPTTESYKYSGPISFSQAMTVKAIAVKEGMLDSEVATASYSLYIEGLEKASFDFTRDGNARFIADKQIEANNYQTDDASNNLNGVVFTEEENGVVTFVPNKAEGTTPPRWWSTATIEPELRVYKNNTYVFSLVKNGYKLHSIKMEQGEASASNYNAITMTASVGTWSDDTKTWTAPAESLVNSVTLTCGANGRCGGFIVEYLPDPDGLAGIDGIDADNAGAPVEYYNLQGLRVSAENLVPGIYVRRQGTEVIKVLVK